jgi:hypothetical protein
VPQDEQLAGVLYLTFQHRMTSRPIDSFPVTQVRN